MVTEPAFGLPLWLQAPCCGDTLWAFNEAHLDFVARYVRATIRERASVEGVGGAFFRDTYYGSIPNALPTWIKRSHHREQVLAVLAKLRDRLPPGLITASNS